MSPNLELKKYVKKATRSDTAATKCEPLTIFLVPGNNDRPSTNRNAMAGCMPTAHRRPRSVNRRQDSTLPVVVDQTKCAPLKKQPLVSLKIGMLLLSWSRRPSTRSHMPRYIPTD